MNTFPRISLPVKAVRKALTILKPLMTRFKPILATVQIERGPSGTWVCASNLEITARIRVDSQYNRETDRVNVDHKRLAECLKSTKADNAYLGLDDGNARIEVGCADVSIPAWDPAEYPAVPHFDASSWRCFSNDEFIRAIERVAINCDPSATRFAMGTIAIEHVTDDRTQFVATDGRRLGFSDLNSWYGTDPESTSPRVYETFPSGQNHPMLFLPAALIAKECAKAAPDSPRVDIAWSKGDEGFAVRIEDYAEITVRNVQGVFPPWKAATVDYSENHTFFEIESADLLDNVKAALATVADDERCGLTVLAVPDGAEGKPGVYLQVDAGKAAKYAARAAAGYVAGPMVDIEIDARYLKQAIEVVGRTAGKTKTAPVRFQIASHDEALTLKCGGLHTVVLMPLVDNERRAEKDKSKLAGLSKTGRRVFNRVNGIAEPEPTPAPEPTPEPEPAVSGDRAASLLVNALAVRPVGSETVVYARENDADTQWWKAEPEPETCWWRFSARQVFTYHAIFEEIQAGTLEVCEVPPLACFHRAPVVAPVVAPAVVVASEPEPADDEPYDCPMLRQRRKDRETLRANRERYNERLRTARAAREASYSLRLTQIRDEIRETLRSLRAARYFDRNDSERLEVLAQWRSVRRHWLNLPENRDRIESQRERSEVRHRDKLSLFGRQTPNERPYDGPAPIAPPVPTPVKPKRVRTPKAAPAVAPRPEFSGSEDTPRPGFSGVDVIAPTVRTVRRIGERRVYVRSWMGWFPHNPDADGIYVRDNSGPMTTLEVSIEVQAGTMEISPDVPTMKPGKPTETVRENVPTIDPAALAAFATIVLFHPEPSELWTLSTVDVEFGRTLLRSAGRSTPEAKAAERARRFAHSLALSPIANRIRTLKPIGKPVTPQPGFSGSPRPEFSGLGIGIRGTVYGLEILGDGFRLSGPNGTYDVSPCSDPVKANQGYRCDCPDHERRHAGNPTKGCKHVNALREVGLIPTTTVERGPDGTPEVPYTPAPEFSGVAAVETLPPVCGGSGDDTVAIHPWQAKGLGMAPFRFRTTIEHPSKSLQEANTDAYNYAAGIASQQRRALKLEDTCTCHACYRDITVAYVIESADGKRFVVGCECVLKTDDTQLITRVEAAKRERNRKASRKRAEVKRAEKAIVAKADAELASTVNAPIIEALERHPSGWAGQAVAELRRKPAAKCSPRFLDAVYRMCSEVTGEPAEHFRDMATA